MKKGAVRLTEWCVFVFLGFLTLAGLRPLAAQTSTGTITGTLTDPQGLPMADATVVVHNVDTGVDHSFMSNDAGLFVAALLEPGNYEVTASKTGFNTVDQKGVMLIVGQTITLDFKMSLQTQQGTVTVTSEAPLIETEKTDQSEAISDTLVAGLPTNSRRWQDFVLLTPGVTTDGSSGLTSFRGISGLYNNNSVDGANNSQAFF